MNKELLKEAYERGCPFCGASGDVLVAVKERQGRMDCGISPFGTLIEEKWVGMEFVASVYCAACEGMLYINGEWM